MAARPADVQVVGLSRLRSTMRAAGADLDALLDAHAEVAALVANAAATLAPRRTGRLSASVRGNRAAGRASVLSGGAAIPYAGPIHWGWPARHIKAQPFVTRAIDTTRSTWLPTYEHSVEQIVDTIKGA